MRRLIAALLIWMRIAAPALAQGGPGPIKIVTTCGTQSLTVSGALGLVFYMDHTGNLCTSATGGGGGGSVTQGTTPWADDITQWANGTLGAMANYGTSPGAVAVPGVNAFVTNPVAVTGTFFQTTQPVSISQGTPGTTNGVQTLTGSTTAVTQATAGNLNATVVGAGTAGTANANPVTVQGIAGMTKLLVTPDSVALPANQSVNLAQINATSTASLMVPASTAPVTATNPALTVDLRPDSPGIIALGPATIANSVPVIPSSQYPGNATAAAAPVTATATGTTAATVATIPAVASKTAYICGFTITADATALAVGTAVVSGTISGSLSYLQGIFAVTSGASDLTKSFNPCIPASAANTAIAVTSAAAGTGGNTIVNVQGYYL